ncbi:MAG: NfeD family protein [Cytophagales bacterium]|nr:NfeD family protein [Cytophagales bacterium]
METSTVWWLLAGLMAALELMSGTFYLLMLALGMAAGAISAHLGLGGTAQLTVAALVAAAAVLLWHRIRPDKSKHAVDRSPDVHLDIGNTVEVKQWASPQATVVVHRGAEWSARLMQQGLPEDALPKIGPHRIVAVDGNTLVLSKI